MAAASAPTAPMVVFSAGAAVADRRNRPSQTAPGCARTGGDIARASRAHEQTLSEAPSRHQAHAGQGRGARRRRKFGDRGCRGRKRSATNRPDQCRERSRRKLAGRQDGKTLREQTNFCGQHRGDPHVLIRAAVPRAPRHRRRGHGSRRRCRSHRGAAPATVRAALTDRSSTGPPSSPARPRGACRAAIPVQHRAMAATARTVGHSTSRAMPARPPRPLPARPRISTVSA